MDDPGDNYTCFTGWHAQQNGAGPVGLAMLQVVNLWRFDSMLGGGLADRVRIELVQRLRAGRHAPSFTQKFGTDKIMLAWPGLGDAGALLPRLQTALAELAGEIRIGDCCFVPRLALGASAGETGTTEPARLLEQASVALAEAPAGGPPRVYSAEMGARMAQNRIMLGELCDGLQQGQILPHFQPQIDAISGRVTGFEMLARWHHPNRGLIGPQGFITLAEVAGLGAALSGAILPRALDALSAWRADGFNIPSLSLNLTAVELRDPALVDRLLLELDRFGLTTADIRVEILESAVVEGPQDPLLDSVKRLQALGIAVDLDDFGYGGASVWNLRTLSIDRLKIDRHFVTALQHNAKKRELARAIIALARSLEIEVVAEGVETEEEWQTLVDLGCHGLQGYAIGRPMPAEAVERWLADYEARRRQKRQRSSALG